MTEGDLAPAFSHTALRLEAKPVVHLAKLRRILVGTHSFLYPELTAVCGTKLWGAAEGKKPTCKRCLKVSRK